MKRTLVINYLVLLLILLVGMWAFNMVRPNVTLQLTVGIVTAVAYVLWGVIHHAMLGDLHHKIVIEYVLIGAIAIVLLVTMLGF